MILFCYFIVYYRTLKDRNCPTENVISTENDCIAASQELGYDYKNSRLGYDLPAGCYYHHGDGIYLNNITDPASTDPYPNGHHGVCLGTGKSTLNLKGTLELLILLLTILSFTSSIIPCRSLICITPIHFWLKLSSDDRACLK